MYHYVPDFSVVVSNITHVNEYQWYNTIYFKLNTTIDTIDFKYVKSWHVSFPTDINNETKNCIKLTFKYIKFKIDL